MEQRCIEGKPFTSLDELYKDYFLWDEQTLKDHIIHLSTPDLKEFLQAMLEKLYLTLPQEYHDDRYQLCRTTVYEILNTFTWRELVTHIGYIVDDLPPAKRRRTEIRSFSSCAYEPPRCQDGYWPLELPVPCKTKGQKRYVCAEYHKQPRLMSSSINLDKQKANMNFYLSQEYIDAFNTIRAHLNNFEVNEYFGNKKQEIDTDRHRTKKDKEHAIMELIRDIPRIANMYEEKKYAYYREPLIKDTWNNWRVVPHPHKPKEVAFEDTNTGDISLFAPATSPWTLMKGMAVNEWVVEDSLLFPPFFQFRNLISGKITMIMPSALPFYHPITKKDTMKLGSYRGPWVTLYSIIHQKPYYFNTQTQTTSYDLPPL